MKCFKGIIANGLFILIPYQDSSTYETPNVHGEDNATHGETQFNYEADNEEQPNAMQTASNVNAKRKRGEKGKKI